MAQVAQRNIPTIDDLKVKLCYICREEERYDAPEVPPKAWTHPCNCTLVAHEACLLHWIQTSQQNRSRAANALKCPQCGTAYELESKNPLLLRLMDAANRGLSTMGKVVTIASLTVVVVSLGTGMYIISTAYGAYALKEFLGEEMFNLLLTEDPSNWPWHSFINLPLIPLALIISRLPLDIGVTPIVPVLLAWPTSSPVHSRDRIILELWKSSADVLKRSSYPMLPSWPPPPLFLGLFIYPVVRGAYKVLLTKFSRWVLNTQPEQANAPVQRVVLALNDDGPFRIRIGANLEDPAADRPGRVQAGQADAQPGDAADNAEAEGLPDDAAVAAENTIRVSGTSLGRLIGGALIIPRISSFMGSLLFRMSKHSWVLRRLLAIRPPLPSGLVPPALFPMYDEKAWRAMSTAKQIGVAGVMGLSVMWRGTYAWAECDPVWSASSVSILAAILLTFTRRWRNSLGLGIFTVAKDCLHLLHLWLTKRELESRRVKNRSFEGVDIRELDLINPAPAS
ncbi:hypothetical protein BV22DRAFT_297175 [Leucogyrophana mollusca]|uniref:Uncharacterized protein n=1 Tax=Leucogyrophana mollusca TaxID=85980 RepID=A0ACB8BPK1_9AGAM|nr:hypothetical protein BV22DRAFT_297175 [Leucogyrophana mollusca]